MARSTTGKSRFKIQRSLGLELPGLGKAGAMERRPYGPGQHGNKRKKISDLAVRMKEKQKLISELEAILKSAAKIKSIVKDELKVLAEKNQRKILLDAKMFFHFCGRACRFNNFYVCGFL